MPLLARSAFPFIGDVWRSRQCLFTPRIRLKCFSAGACPSTLKCCSTFGGKQASDCRSTSSSTTFWPSRATRPSRVRPPACPTPIGYFYVPPCFSPPASPSLPPSLPSSLPVVPRPSLLSSMTCPRFTFPTSIALNKSSWVLPFSSLCIEVAYFLCGSPGTLTLNSSHVSRTCRHQYTSEE